MYVNTYAYWLQILHAVLSKMVIRPFDGKIFFFFFFLPMLEVLRDVNGLSLKLKPSSSILCWIGVLLFFLHLVFHSWICLSFVFWIDCTSPLVHRQCTRFVFHSNIYIFFHYLYRKKDKWVMIGYHTHKISEAKWIFLVNKCQSKKRSSYHKDFTFFFLFLQNGPKTIHDWGILTLKMNQKRNIDWFYLQ